MTVREPDELGWTRPPNAAIDKASRELVELVSAHLPQRFYKGEAYWRLLSAAMVVRMADTVDAMRALMAHGLSVDGSILLRALYEQVVTYLWLAIDPETRKDAWASNAHWHLRKLHHDALAFGETVLSKSQLAATDDSAKRMALADMAAEADSHWGGRMIGFRAPETGKQGILTMRGMYVAVYRISSRAAHAQPDSLDPYCDPTIYPAVVSRARRDEPSIWWPLAVPLYAHALLICHDQLNWPDPDRVRQINDAMYSALREETERLPRDP